MFIIIKDTDALRHCINRQKDEGLVFIGLLFIFIINLVKI